MTEYIERKRAIVDACNSLELYSFEYAKLEDALNKIPAADVAHVRHGRWEWDTEDIYRCSNCAEKSHVKEVMGHPEWDYCPNCGAKMDGGDDNGEA